MTTRGRNRAALFDELARSERHNKGRKSVPSLCDMQRQALMSQGTHETDIIFEKLPAPSYEPSDLHKDAILCLKNFTQRHHTNFTPVSKLSVSSLPAGFRDRDIYECVMRLVTLTVILRVGHTSKNRPDMYDFYEQRGDKAARHYRLGTGSAFIPRRKRRQTKCTCRECKNSPHSSKPSRFIWISTAQHVVYDDIEGECTEVGVYFDGVQNGRKPQWLQGVRVVNFDPDNDRCILECVTHDLELYHDIKRARRFLRRNERKLVEKYLQKIEEKGQPLLAVIVSHPHGCCKQVSFGTVVEKKHLRGSCDQVEWTEYLYNAATCCGCSGALVWLLGQERVGYRDSFITTHTHTGVYDGRRNRSGGGLDFVRCSKKPKPTSVVQDDVDTSTEPAFVLPRTNLFCFFCKSVSFSLFALVLMLFIFQHRL